MPYIIDSITAETVNVNQEILLDGRPVSSIPADTIEVTYEELYGHYTGGTLEKNAYYLITDFQTLHIIPNTTERNDTNVTIPVEPLIVFATGVNQLAPQAWSTVYPKDVIEYDITGDYLGAQKPSGHKGCITYRKTYGYGSGSGIFECIFDFRHFVARTWCYEMESAWYSALGFTINFATNGIQRGWNNTLSTLVIKVLDGTSVTKTLTLLPESLNVFNAISNPYGYKDQYYFQNNPASLRFGVQIQGSFITRTIPVIFTRSFNEDDLIGFALNANGGVVNNAVFKTNSFSLNCTNPNAVNQFRYYGLLNNAGGTYNLRGDSIGTTTITCAEAGGGSLTMDGNCRTNSFLNLRSSFGTEGLKVAGEVVDTVVKFPNAAQGTGVRYNIENCVGANITLPLRNIRYSGFGIRLTSGEHNVSTIIVDTRFRSLETRTVAAVSAIDLSTTDLAIAGILNLTGTGTVNIATLQRWNNGVQIFHPITLRPASGLTISIAPNNVANGFIQSGTITANGTNGEVIRLELVNDRWLAMN